MKRFKNSVLIRGVIFLIISFIMMPAAVHYAAQGKNLFVEVSFFQLWSYTLAVVVLFIVFNREFIAQHHFKVSKLESVIFSSISLLLFAGYYFVRFRMHYSIDNYIYILILSVIIYSLCVFALALSFFGYGFFRKVYRSLIVFVSINYLFFITYVLLSLSKLSEFTAAFVNTLLSFFSSGTSLVMHSDIPSLSLGDFTVNIGPACSGVQSLFMFAGLFILLVVYEYKRLDFERSAFVFVLGLISIYLLNIIRVTVLMVIGQKYPGFALGMFHSNAAWILFSVYMLVLMYCCYSWMKKNPSKGDKKF